MAQRYCTNCGHELSPGDRFCTNCGTPVYDGVPAEAPPPQQAPQRAGGWSARRVLFLVFVVPVLAAVAWLVFQFALGFLEGLLIGG